MRENIIVIFMKPNYGEIRAYRPGNLTKSKSMNIDLNAQTILPWIDLLWVPVALLTMERGKRLLTCGFVLSCSLLLRLQVELLQQVGYPYGFFRLMDTGIFTRGLITYGGFITLFLLLAYYSPGSNKSVHMAASITILIAAFCVSFLIMVL